MSNIRDLANHPHRSEITLLLSSLNNQSKKKTERSGMHLSYQKSFLQTRPVGLGELHLLLHHRALCHCTHLSKPHCSSSQLPAKSCGRQHWGLPIVCLQFNFPNSPNPLVWSTSPLQPCYSEYSLSGLCCADYS